ncbi:MAG TPA: hypothetical protein VIR03_02850 [Candidatus Saccharimonadales bacterium]
MPKTTATKQAKQNSKPTIAAPIQVPRLRLTKRTIIISSVAAVLLLSGGTVWAAQGSLPGQPLYSVKLASEQVRLALSFTSGMEQSTRASIAQRRLEEIKSLLSEPEKNKELVNSTLAKFESENKSLASTVASGTTAGKILEIEKQYAETKAEIDKKYETAQKTVEQNREQLKRQYEDAVKAGDTAMAQSLQTQIATTETQLKALETNRETAKQQIESATTSVTTSAPDAVQKEVDQKHQQELQQEQLKQQQEQQQHQAEQQQAQDQNLTQNGQ